MEWKASKQAVNLDNQLERWRKSEL